MESVRIKTIFPLAKLAPLFLLTAVAVILALLIQITDEIANSWTAIGILPLALYLGNSHLQARKLLLAEKGREREIVQAGFVALAAERAAKFWGALFSAVVVSTLVVSVASWGYQVFLWFDQERWVALTWLNLTQWIPNTGHPLLQKSVYWFADTNFGVVILVAGLLIAAPIAAIHWRANNKAKYRRNDLASLKQRS